MPTEARYVAVSADQQDRQIYAGPAPAMLPAAPEGREWISEYRAMAAGYWYPGGYQPEEWAAGAGTPAEETPIAHSIHDALKRHLTRSNAFLADPPSSTNAEIVKQAMRHERSINLILRALLEVFDVAPPAVVMEGATGDSANPATRNTDN